MDAAGVLAVRPVHCSYWEQRGPSRPCRFRHLAVGELSLPAER